MNKKLLASVAGVVALAAAGSAAAQDAGWYVRGDLGATSGGELDADAPIDLDDGWAVGVGGGYAFGNGLRTEGELLYLSNDLDNGAEGETSTLGAFANVAYDFNRGGRIRPFVGAGLGFAQVDFDDGTIDDDDIGFAYQAKVGVAYDINDRLSTEVAYRYIAIPDVEFGSGATGPLSADLDNQAVTVGLRYKLGY